MARAFENPSHESVPDGAYTAKLRQKGEKEWQLDGSIEKIREHYFVAEAMMQRDVKLAQQRNRERVNRIRKDILDNIHLFD